MSATSVRPTQGDALILTDVQHDFLPGGSLGVADGDAIIGPLNAMIEQFVQQGLPVVATRDWHPANHVSFVAQGGPWPTHCVQGTQGAAFAPELRIPDGAIIISKATDPDQDAYSGFQGTDLDRQLRALGVHRVFVGGLATDYCVLNTVLDARRLGYDVVLLAEAVRAVDVQPGDGEAALAQMADAGAVVVPAA
jgi:nicotinamidase/pyrazinamidase